MPNARIQETDTQFGNTYTTYARMCVFVCMRNRNALSIDVRGLCSCVCVCAIIAVRLHIHTLFLSTYNVNYYVNSGGENEMKERYARIFAPS